jgi:tetraacyldisaccharide 4'-kinase
MQFHLKFNKVVVAVDENRSRGLRQLMEKDPAPEVVLLDDAFQHRYVKPGLSILLTDYRSVYYEDMMLPSGTLREFSSGAARADIIVVTKTPKIFSPITRRRILEEMKPDSRQQVFFSYISYGTLKPVFSDYTEIPSKIISVLLFTGIANDYPLREHLERQCSDLNVLRFPDHHSYSVTDIQRIIQKFQDLPTQKKIMVTTEKDSMRLKNEEFATYFKNLPLFCIPIEVEFHGSDKKQFDEEILNYVAETIRKH